MRTWIIERNFQIPPLYVDVDEHLERRRRARSLASSKLSSTFDSSRMIRWKRRTSSSERSSSSGCGMSGSRSSGLVPIP
jgi:hypothetical protein